METKATGLHSAVAGSVKVLSSNTVSLTVTEGKSRMVRRMLANAGHPVVDLKRVRVGGIVLDEGLEEGTFAEVAEEAQGWVKEFQVAALDNVKEGLK